MWFFSHPRLAFLAEAVGCYLVVLMQNQGDDDSGSAPSDAEVAFPMCWLCEKSDAGVTKRGLKGLKFHGKCLNAVLARYCQFRNGGSSSKNAKKAREADQKEMLDSAATWRPKVLPMLSADRETKSKARREARALTTFSEDLKLDGVYAMEDDCLKTFRGYQRFRAEESDVESEQAQAEFEAILAEQGDRWTHASGKQRIRVADPNAGKVRSAIGHETRGGQRERQDIDDVQRGVLQFNLARGRRDLVSPRDVAGLVARSSRCGIPILDAKLSLQVCRQGSGLNGKGSVSSASVHEGRCQSMAHRSQSRSPCKRSAAPDESTRRRKKQRRKTPGDGATPWVRKDALLIQIENLIASLMTNETSLMLSLQKAAGELRRRKGMWQDCPHSWSALQKEIQGIGAELNRLSSKVNNAHVDEVESHSKTFDDIKESVAKLKGKVDDQLDAIEYKTTKRTNADRTKYHKQYWQNQKTAQHLVDGQHSHNFAKLLAETITTFGDVMHAVGDQVKVDHPEHVKQNLTIEEFDGTKLAVWSHDASGSDLGKALSEYFTKHKDIFDAKRDSLDAKLRSEPSWLGTVGEVAAPVLGDAIEWAQSLVLHEKKDMLGARPWMVVMRRNKKRIGPTAVPSLGWPVCIHPMTDVVLHCCPAAPLLADGVPLATYEAYASGEDGGKEVRKFSSTLLVRAGCSAFLPAGYVANLIFYKTPERKPAMNDRSLGCVLVCPMLFKSCIDSLEASVRTAFLTWHHTAAKDKKKDMWLQRKECLGAVLGVPE